MQIDLKLLFGPHDLKAFGVGLHHAILYPVVDHLDKVATANWSTVDVAPRRGQGEEGRLEPLDQLLLATNHQTETILQAPDPTRGALVDVVEPLGLELSSPALVVVEVGVPTINNRVTRLQQRGKGANHALGDCTCG